MDAEGASVVLSLFLISETNKGKTTNMKTKLKKVVPSASCLVLSAKKMLAVALCAVGLSAFAEESVTINEVKSVQPWDKAKGTITVDYSLGGLDAAKEYKVAFDITANGVTKGVTNAAAKLTSGQQTVFTYDTVSLFGAETRAEDAKVKVSLIAIKASSEPEYVEIGGVKWATKNIGAEKETDYGYYFAWGGTEGYVYSDGQWKSGKDGSELSGGFSQANAPHYSTLDSKYTKYTTGETGDGKTVLESGDDAATALLGSGWRMPTSAEFKALYDACGGKSKPTAGGSTSTTEKGVYWCDNYDGVKGLLFCDGTNKLFFPAAGRSDSASLKEAGSDGYYWSSSLYANNTANAYSLYFYSGNVNCKYNSINRKYGFSVRPVKEVK